MTAVVKVLIIFPSAFMTAGQCALLSCSDGFVEPENISDLRLYQEVTIPYLSLDSQAYERQLYVPQCGHRHKAENQNSTTCNNRI
jgi:hypothetical protein